MGSRCLLCNNEAEVTNNHLFLHCRITPQIWTLFLSLTDTKWIMAEHTADLTSCWIERGGTKSSKKWWGSNSTLYMVDGIERKEQ